MVGDSSLLIDVVDNFNYGVLGNRAETRDEGNCFRITARTQVPDLDKVFSLEEFLVNHGLSAIPKNKLRLNMIEFDLLSDLFDFSWFIEFVELLKVLFGLASENMPLLIDVVSEIVILIQKSVLQQTFDFSVR